MSETSNSISMASSRRDFLKTSGAAVATGALAASLGIARQAHAAAADDTLKVALIGCGGRGTGAVKDAISAKGSNVKLIAMADAFRDHLDASLDGLKKEFAERIDVPADRQFIGFDAYKQALATDADVVILATPPGFRPIHFEAAVKAGKHIFTEKPLATDAGGPRDFGRERHCQAKETGRGSRPAAAPSGRLQRITEAIPRWRDRRVRRRPGLLERNAALDPSPGRFANPA